MGGKPLQNAPAWLTGILLAACVWLMPEPCPAIENEECMECHSDETLARDESEGMKENLFVDYYRYELSVHNINGLMCIDCHSGIQELNWEEEVPHPTALKMVDCGMCHEEEEEAYQNSVHKEASHRGITIPCYACHGYHFVTRLEANSVYERENKFCLRCHDPYPFHDWLPQKEVHFTYVECAVCHSVEVPLHIALRFYDLVQDRFLDSDVFLETLNTDYAGFMGLVDTNSDGIIDLEEFENIVLLLRQRDVIGTFHGELVVDLVPEVHQVKRAQANRDCEQCHDANSPFFREVHICVNRKDGTRAHFLVKREVLESYYVNHFYALRGTRVRFLDKVGIALVVGGLGVVAAHLTVRLATIPTRQRRQSGKGSHGA